MCGYKAVMFTATTSRLGMVSDHPVVALAQVWPSKLLCPSCHRNCFEHDVLLPHSIHKVHLQLCGQ